MARTHITPIILAGLFAGLAAAQDPAADEKRLEGTWRVVATTFDGKASPEAQIKGRALVFQGREFTTVVDGKKGRGLSFTLDPSKDPKQIDLKRVGQDRAAKGVYALTDDELKLCYGEPGADRPTTFASEPGSKVFLLVLRRDKR